MTEQTPHMEAIRGKLGAAVIDAHAFRGDETVIVRREGLLETFRALKEDPALRFDFLSDLTAVDYLGKKEPRFEVVYHLLSLPNKSRLRVKVPVPESDPEVDSLIPLWKAADWM